MATTETETSPTRARTAPSVLVILVVKDGQPWLRAALSALARQDYPRLGVVAVDNASTDGSSEILQGILGEARVFRLPENVGFPAAVNEGLARAGKAASADYLLLLHDDTMLSPDAVSRMVEVAERIEGAGVVGPKVVDWEDPTVLREVGLSADRFGYPYSPLEEEELDHGQYDRAREVLYVSSSAMLVSRETWQRVGLPDERFGSYHEDLDFCWRARLAGFRVLMNPQAVSRHRGASIRAERVGGLAPRRDRYYAERASLASVLKNYSILTLLWLLPLYVGQGVGRVAVFLLERRFDEAWQILAAWGWNILHLPGTIRRRVRSQAVRAVPDREIRRFMAPAGIRFRRLVQQGSAAIWGRGGRLEDVEIEEGPAVRERLSAYALSHPVMVAWALFAVVALLAYRNLITATPLEGGTLATMPERAFSFFREFASGWRHSGLGGPGTGSPALVAEGAASLVTFGSPALFQKVFLLALPPLAGVSMYRAILAVGREKGPAVVAASCYGLSAAMLGAFSLGRIDVLVLLAVTPWLAQRLWAATGPAWASEGRVIVGTGVGVAVGAAFFPGTALAAGLLVLVGLIVPESRGRRMAGLRIALGAAAVAGVLLFPTAIALASAPSALRDGAGHASLGSLVRLSLGAAPGAWLLALFLPVAAAVGFAFIETEHARWAARAVIAALAGLALAWAGAAGYLPAVLTNPPAFLAVTAVSYCLLVGLAFTALVPGVRGHTFGARQLGYAVLTGIVGFGLLVQAFQAARGAWAVGEGKLPPAWPVVAEAPGPASVRVLWLGDPGTDAFPAPGGIPQGVVAAGKASVAYKVTGLTGTSPFDLAVASGGPGYATLRAALVESLAGDVHHLGAQLQPFGIRFVVAGEGSLPDRAAASLARQVDLDLIQTAGGLAIYRNARLMPTVAAVTGEGWISAGRRGDILEAGAADPPQGQALRQLGDSKFEGRTGGAQAALVADTYDGGWRLGTEGGPTVSPQRAFGWAMLFPLPAGDAPFVIAYGRQWVRTLEVLILVVVWLGALWLTRRAPKTPRP